VILRLVSRTALVVALVCAGARPDIVDRLDQPAGELLASTWWNGAPGKLEAQRGKVVIVHVSDPSRATSKAFAPNLAKLVEARKGEPFVVYEVVVSDDEDVAAEYAREAKWPVGWDGKGDFQRAYPGSSVPRTYVIGPDGRVAFHMHIMALTKETLDAQVSRCGFYDPAKIPERARPAARSMLDQKYGDAIERSDKVFADPAAPGDAKAFCARVKKEVARYYVLQKNLVEALCKDLDWAVAYHRVERMLVVYKGTDHEAEVQAKKAELDANPRVKYIVELQKKLDHVVEDVNRAGRADLEKIIERLQKIIDEAPKSAPALKAQDWIDECRRKLSKGGR
jgi:hypothetical protein